MAALTKVPNPYNGQTMFIIDEKRRELLAIYETVKPSINSTHALKNFFLNGTDYFLIADFRRRPAHSIIWGKLSNTIVAQEFSSSWFSQLAYVSKVDGCPGGLECFQTNIPFVHCIMFVQNDDFDPTRFHFEQGDDAVWKC